MVNLKLWVALFGVALSEASILQHKHAKLTTRKDKDDEEDGDDDSGDDDEATKTKSDGDADMLNDAPKKPAPAPVEKKEPAPKVEEKPAPPPPAPKPETVKVVAPPAPKPKMPWAKPESHLAQVQARQQQLENELKIWSDHAEWDKKIDADKAALSAATTSALADMLGDIRTELHQLAVPVYTDVLYDNLDALGEKESMLKAQIKDMKAEWEKNHVEKENPWEGEEPEEKENPWDGEKKQAEAENPWDDEPVKKQAPTVETEKEKEEEVRKAETILVVGGLAGGFLAVLAVYLFTKR